MTTPKIIFIDWNGTLCKSKFWGHLEASEPELFTKIEDNLFKKNVDLIKPWMKGELTSEDVVRKISDETGIEHTKVLNEFIKGCELMEYVDTKVPELIKKLKKKGFKVYIASDNMDSFNRWTIPAMKLDKLFDGIINSFSIKALKHDFAEDGTSLFFGDVLKKENVLPNRTMLIDDSEDGENILTKYGISYCRISEKWSLVNELSRI